MSFLPAKEHQSNRLVQLMHKLETFDLMDTNAGFAVSHSLCVTACCGVWSITNKYLSSVYCPLAQNNFS